MSTATAEANDVSMGVLIACVLGAVAVGVGTFVVTHSILLAVVGYITTACFSYALTWVIA